MATATEVKTEKTRTTSFQDLTPALIENILTRLPAKTLIRFSALNKPWYALIHNPNFISSHINRCLSLINNCTTNSSNVDRLILVIPGKKLPKKETPCALISEKTYSVVENIENPFQAKRSRTFNLVGSVHGVVCLTDDAKFQYGWDLCLWNPSIRKHVRVEMSSSCLVWVPVVDHSKYPVLGFGFCKGTGDYKVVRIVYQADYSKNFFGRQSPKAEVFSLRGNAWKEVRSARVPRLVTRRSVFVDGVVYWLESGDKAADAEAPESLWLVSFDFEEELFGEVRGPDVYGEWAAADMVGSEVYVLLTEFRGSVSVLVNTRRGGLGARFYLWVMGNEGGTLSWSKQFSVELKTTMGWPLNVTRSGKLVIYPDDGNMLSQLVAYDIKSHELKKMGIDGRLIVDTAFIESLVLLEEGNALAGPATEPIVDTFEFFG